MLAILFGVQLFPKEIIATTTATLIALGIIAFALFYYYVAWKFFAIEQRRFLRDLSDIIFMGMIILVAKDYGVFFFVLLFLPIAAAAFALELVHALIIATAGAAIIILEVILSSQGYLDETRLLLSGGQILIFVLITLLTRFLALQIRHERDEKERAKARAAQLAQALEEERRLEGMEREFVNLTSHQLLTPISIIRGFASLLREQAKRLDKDQREFVDEIYENSRRMVRLIDDLRLEARISQHRYPIHPNRQPFIPFMRDLIDEFRPRAKEARLTLKSHLLAKNLEGRFDREATRQILWNILENALVYTHRRGTVTIAVKKEGKSLTITVTDTGIGIPEAEQGKIFQRFFRASNAIGVHRDGSGLGLAIAKELTERQQGTLSFTSDVKKGSTFTLSLPL